MAGSTKIFQFIQKVHKIFGFDSSHPNSTNLRQILFLIAHGQLLISLFAYLVIEAKEMFDYGFGLHNLTSIAISVIVYLLFIWQLENTMKFIENCEKFIENSK